LEVFEHLPDLSVGAKLVIEPAMKMLLVCLCVCLLALSPIILNNLLKFNELKVPVNNNNTDMRGRDSNRLFI